MKADLQSPRRSMKPLRSLVACLFIFPIFLDAQDAGAATLRITYEITAASYCSVGSSNCPRPPGPSLPNPRGRSVSGTLRVTVSDQLARVGAFNALITRRDRTQYYDYYFPGSIRTAVDEITRVIVPAPFYGVLVDGDFSGMHGPGGEFYTAYSLANRFFTPRDYDWNPLAGQLNFQMSGDQAVGTLQFEYSGEFIGFPLTSSGILTFIGQEIDREQLAACSDGIDNDGDELTDMDDPECTSARWDNESRRPRLLRDGCAQSIAGLALLPTLLWLRSRQR